MSVIRPYGFKKIHQGLLVSILSDCLYVLVEIAVLCYLIFSGKAEDDDALSSVTSIIALISNTFSFLASVLIINGLIESSKGIAPLERARTWMLIHISVNALKIAVNGITNSFQTSPDSAIYILSLVTGLVFSFITIFTVYFAYRDILLGFSEVWYVCGGEKKTAKYITDLRRNLDCVAAFIILLILYFDLIIFTNKINGDLQITSAEAWLILLFVAALIWLGVIRILMVKVSRRVSSTISEISK